MIGIAETQADLWTAPAGPSEASLLAPTVGGRSNPPSVQRGVNGQTRTTVDLDWLRFVGPDSKVRWAVALLTQSLKMNATPGGGRYFLDASMRFGNAGGVFYAQNESSTATHCVVELPSSLIHQISKDERLQLVDDLLAGGFRASRIDVAVDYESDAVDLVYRVIRACKGGHLTGTRTEKPMVERVSGDYRMHGHCLGRRGSNGSGRYVRVYDKGLEQRTNDIGEWVRWETEFTGDAANQVAMRIANCNTATVDETMRAVALGAVDFREGSRDDKLSRRERQLWWQDLLDGVVTERVIAERTKPQVETYCAWIKRCVAPQLRTMAVAWDMTPTELLIELTGDDELNPDILEREVPHAMTLERGTSKDVARERVREWMHIGVWGMQE